ncbi:MFS transporter [Corynebacterium aquilae]|uniref:MFS transporter n=1 Tax=Corynebacterium aquilae TaxID=203263 RepID=UPI000952B136|nr:MFS transporter [Corynebacterium aquilae]
MTSTSIYRGKLAPTTAGVLIAVIACAFDQTAVTAVMPAITDALGGTSAYSLSFVLPLATGVVGMVSAGLLTDRFGARTSMMAGCYTFLVGLVLAMVSPTMAIFVLSRAIQGLGAGAVIVAIYSVIGLAYPARLRPKVFAAFAGAYVLPSLVGPALAGAIAELTSWHGVFGLVIVTLVVAMLLLSRVLRTLPRGGDSAPRSKRQAVVAAVLVALCVAAMNFSSQLSSLLFAVALLLAGLVGTLLAVRPLVPGRNRLMVTRALIDMFFAAEIYLPLLLSQNYHLGPTLTGMGLTVAGVTWFGASWAQSRFGGAFALQSVMLSSFAVMGAGTALMTVSAALETHWGVSVAGWGIAAAGMGFVYPRLSSETLERAGASNTGFHGSALQVMGTVGMTSMISIAGLLQTSGARFFPDYKFTALFLAITAVTVPLVALWSPKSPWGPGRG